MKIIFLKVVVGKSNESIELFNLDTSFSIGKARVEGQPKSFEQLQQQTRFIVGSGPNLSIFDYGSADFFKDDSIPYAHGDDIKGVSSHPSSMKVWATCSLDHSCFQWDKSNFNQKPASVIL